MVLWYSVTAAQDKRASKGNVQGGSLQQCPQQEKKETIEIDTNRGGRTELLSADLCNNYKWEAT